MEITSINTESLSRMFLAGAKNLEAKKEWINELNVFPVPDGDTGTNMSMTIMSAAREVGALSNPTMKELAKAISSGSLRGARGNSGVILSQLFRGFCKVIKEYDEVKTGFTYFAENDVLFAKITPCMENGKGAVAKGLHNGIGFGSTEFHVLRPISGKTDPYWIYTLTAFSQFRMDAASNMTGSAGQRRVPASFLVNYRVSLPPIALQEQFAAFVEQTDKSKLAVQKGLQELEILKKSLMQQYFG